METTIKEQLLKAQKNEMTEYHIYKKIANRVKGKNRNI